MILGTYTSWFDSPITPWSTLATLIVVVMIAMGKEGLEDWKRHRADRVTNSQTTRRFIPTIHASPSNSEPTFWQSIVHSIWRQERKIPVQSTFPPPLSDCQWKSIVVGDIVKIQNNENVPADMVLIGSSEPFGNAFVETSNIDGETNLKLKSCALTNANETLWNSILENRRLNLSCRCEAPNASILKFRGTLTALNEEISVDEKSLLLRGCRLKNTAWAVGLVVYTGRESKIVMNSRSTPSKLSLLEKTMNSLVLFVFMLQLGLSLISFVSYLLWSYSYKDNTPYLCVNASSSKNPLLSTFCESATQYSDGGYLVTFFILYNNFIPISLYVTIEVCNYLQAFFIDNDEQMFDPTSNNAAAARTSNMNSDLGMVQYVFSDKTGTLTENVMKFQKLSFAGTVFSISPAGAEHGFDQLRNGHFAPHQEQLDSLLGAILSVCHTVVIDASTREIKAESPDEEALLDAAKEIGWEFLGRSPGKISIRVRDSDVEYELIATIPFTSARKRMSVIVKRPDGRILLLCKGADNVLLSLAGSENRSLSFPGTTEDALQRDLQRFAVEGLRTLVLGYKELSEEELQRFLSLWGDKSMSEDLEQLRARAAALVETDLIIVGATAIEDKLQKGVPETIDFILRSGVKLWVLTGDKMETAINIGYSARLIRRDMIVIRMQYGTDRAATKRKLQLLVQKLDKLVRDTKPFTKSRESLWRSVLNLVTQSKPRSSSFADSYMPGDEEDMPLIDKNTELSGVTSDRLALVVDGGTLLSLIGDKECEDLFLSIAGTCRTVIACRVSPEQKRLLVRLVKTKSIERPLTLSIGDGANDVPMIQEAAIGVGISGREGRQAVNNADFAISQFRFLKRLLFVHGRWNYRRTSKVVLYSFYKNIVLAMSMFYYTFFSGYSGQTMYESNIYGLYNIVLSMPVIAFGIFDRDVPSAKLLAEPDLYAPGRTRADLNWATVFFEFLQAFVDSCFLFFLPYVVYYYAMDMWEDSGKQGGIWLYGFVVYTIILLAMMVRIMLLSCTWTWIWHLFMVGSFAVFIGFAFVYQYMYSYSYDFYGIANKTFQSEMFWLLAFVTCFLSATFKITLDLVSVPPA